MRVIVTGGAGFIGSAVVEQLIERGEDPAVVDVAPARGDGCRHVEASVLDADAMVDAVAGSDVVVHLAGYVRGGMRRSPYEGARLQLQGTLNVLEACRTADVPHVAYASSFYVYDGIPATESVDESTPLDPLMMELFGSAKLMGEALCQEYAKSYGLTYTIYRFGPAYGPGGSSAVGDFIETGLSGETIEVWGRGQRRNQYTFVGDLGAAVVAGLDRKDQTYNLISPEATSLGQLAGMLHEEFGFETRFDEDRPEGPSFPYISAAKAVRELGWQPTSLRDGIRATERALALEAGAPPSHAG